MLPIFDDYIKFIKDKCGLSLCANKYWYDKSIIKGFTKDGKLHKLYRLKVNDDLSMEWVKPDSYENIDEKELISFDELVRLNELHIRYKEFQSLDFLRKMLEKYKDFTPIVPISTGKDSMVTLLLTRMVRENTLAIFNNTSLDVADSYIMAKNISNCKIMNPKEGFYPWVKRTKMYPTRFRRACCSIFKSGVMIEQLDKNEKYLMIMGMRNEESLTRKEYGDEWKNTEWGNVAWQGILPIREWTELDIWLYTFYRNIPINEKYKKGYQRVGCGIACPFYNNGTWVLDEYWYPYLRQRWVDMLTENFIDEGKATILNCTIEEYIQGGWNGGVVRDKPTLNVIKEFQQYKHIKDIDIATKYFNNNCNNCNKKLKKDEVAMSLKFYDEKGSRFLCKTCFMKENDIDKNKYMAYIEKFRDEGCVLF